MLNNFGMIIISIHFNVDIWKKSYTFKSASHKTKALNADVNTETEDNDTYHETVGQPSMNNNDYSNSVHHQENEPILKDASNDSIALISDKIILMKYYDAYHETTK